jgi:hypothetical protein
MHLIRWYRFLFACGGVLAVSACRTDGAIEAALHGDLKTLQSEIRDAQRQGRLDREVVEALARAVAGREVRSAKGEPAVRRLRTVRACAAPLYAVLSDRSSRPDDAGAEAALILLEYGRLEPAHAVTKHAESASGSWRAVAARAATAPEYALLRREFYRDPDERVRRAALHAGLSAKDPGDLDALLEAARLDPDVLSRSIATRAVGAIGGQQAVLRLNDRWAQAEEDVRAVIIEAWAMPRAFEAGGEKELVRIAETASGTLAIAAAHALFTSGGQFRDLGTQVIARAIADGTRSERQLAIRLADVSQQALESAIKEASKDADRYVRVMAHAKLVTLEAHRQQSLKELRELARATGNDAIQARAALAAAGDLSISDALRAQLSAKSAEQRQLAARGLLRLGLYPDVATALGDENPDVRTAVACHVLSIKG